MSRRTGTRERPLAVLGVLALLPALALLALWRWAAGEEQGADPPPPPSTAAAPEPAPVLTTPLLSFRRAPAVLARELNLAGLQQAVTGFAAALNDTSCVAVTVDGVPVGAANADVRLIPASNQKLLTAAVALTALPADHRFTTEVRATPPVDGVVAGELYLVGGGDPLLTSAAYPVQNDLYPVTDPTSLDALADEVVAAGVERVEGRLVGDATRYDDELYAPSWAPDVRAIEAGPYDALMVNDARVSGDPLRAADPAEGAAREFARLLDERGVTVAGGTATGAAPGDATVLASVDSAPLPAVVSEMLATSDNNTAELLVKELAVAAGEAEGSREAGLAVMRETLGEWGLTDVALADGSGLSNENRVSCAGLVEVLGRFGPDDALGAGLPVAGETGTLADAFTDSPVAGRLRAKTGTLGNPPFDADPPAVKALAGYLPVDDGSTIEFALVLNGSGPLADQGVYRPVWDALAAVLAAYPAGPTAADLAPR